jgi:hypothetical protein
MFLHTPLESCLVDVGWQPREVVFVHHGGSLGNHRGWWPYEVGPQLVMAWVAMLCRLRSGMVGLVNVS